MGGGGGRERGEKGWQRDGVAERGVERKRERKSSWRLEVGVGWKGEGNRGWERDRGGRERERELEFDMDCSLGLVKT